MQSPRQNCIVYLGKVIPKSWREKGVWETRKEGRKEKANIGMYYCAVGHWCSIFWILLRTFLKYISEVPTKSTKEGSICP